MLKKLLQCILRPFIKPRVTVYEQPFRPPEEQKQQEERSSDSSPFSGTRPVLIKEERAQVHGAPGLNFSRREITARDEHNTKFSRYETNPRILGCGCLVSSPKDVAYLSDLSGKSVCRRCAKRCACGHKTAPTERINVPQHGLLCVYCYESLQRQEKKKRLLHFFFGAFVKKQ